MSDDDLNARLLAAAEEMVRSGKRMPPSKYGDGCFALVDGLLRKLGAKTAADGDVRVTDTADYDWGDELLSLETLKPGDILQFTNHVVDTAIWRYANNQWYEAEGSRLPRLHHTSIVRKVREDGSVEVIETNVAPNPNRIGPNDILRLTEGEETRNVSNVERIKVRVTGSVRAYHPAPKPPEGALIPPSGKGGARSRASVVPSKGGAKRTPGPVGMEEWLP